MTLYHRMRVHWSLRPLSVIRCAHLGTSTGTLRHRALSFSINCADCHLDRCLGASGVQSCVKLLRQHAIGVTLLLADGRCIHRQTEIFECLRAFSHASYCVSPALRDAYCSNLKCNTTGIASMSRAGKRTAQIRAGIIELHLVSLGWQF